MNTITALNKNDTAAISGGDTYGVAASIVFAYWFSKNNDPVPPSSELIRLGGSICAVVVPLVINKLVGTTIRIGTGYISNQWDTLTKRNGQQTKNTAASIQGVN